MPAPAVHHARDSDRRVATCRAACQRPESSPRQRSAARLGPRRWPRRDPRPAGRGRRRGGPPARRGRGDGLPGRPGDRSPPVRPRRRHQEPAQPRLGPLARSAGRRRDLRPRGGRGRGGPHQRLPGGHRLRPRAGDRSRGRGPRHPLDGRGASDRRRHGHRRAGHVLVARGRVQSRPDRARPRAGRSRRRSDAQRPAHRGARCLPVRAGKGGRPGAVVAPDRRTDQRRRRLPGRHPARRRRGGPAVRRRRLPHRAHRPRDRAARGCVRIGRARLEPDDRDRARRWRLGVLWRRRPGGPDRSPVLDRRIRHGPAVSAVAQRGPAPRVHRHPVGDGRAADRRQRTVRGHHRVDRPARRVGRRRCRPARDHRRPGRHHHPDDPPDRGARPVARRPRPAGAGRAGAPRDRRPDHRPPRAERHPARRRHPGRAPRPGGRGDPRPARSDRRQSALGDGRRAVGGLQRRGAGDPVDLGRGGRDRHRGGRGPGHPRRRRPGVPVPAVTRIRPSSTTARASAR